MDLNEELRRAGVLFAHVAHFPEDVRRPLLERLGEDPDRWPQLEASVIKTLREAVKSGQLELVAAFSSALTEMRGALADRQPTLEEIAPAILGAAASAGASSPPADSAGANPDETLPIAFPTLRGPSGEALPFRPDAAPGRAREQRSTLAKAELPPSGETAEVDPRAFAQFLVEPPFDGPEIDLLTLEQFASCQAELATWPDLAGEVLGRYGVESSRQWSGIRRTWERRRAADPILEQKFGQLLGQYLQYLQHRQATGLGPPRRVP